VVDVLSTKDFLTVVREHADKEFSPDHSVLRAEWYQTVVSLLNRAHERGDGVAIYENADLGHHDIGQWQIVSYGSVISQLETRSTELPRPHEWANGGDVIPKTLPDIGGAINWRYMLRVVCPVK
jgi:hypothetical protein